MIMQTKHMIHGFNWIPPNFENGNCTKHNVKVWNSKKKKREGEEKGQRKRKVNEQFNVKIET